MCCVVCCSSWIFRCFFRYWMVLLIVGCGNWSCLVVFVKLLRWVMCVKMCIVCR